MPTVRAQSPSKSFERFLGTLLDRGFLYYAEYRSHGASHWLSHCASIEEAIRHLCTHTVPQQRTDIYATCGDVVILLPDLYEACTSCWRDVIDPIT